MSPLSLNNHTEKELITLCLQGDRIACKQLFDIYSKKMMALCFRYARDYSEAQDIMQEGFVRIFNKLDLYSGQGSFEAWMRRVMINTALKYRQRYVVKHSYSELGDQHFFDQMPTVIDELSKDDILKLVQELPDGYRTIFNLYIIEGFSHRDISEMLNIGESTSRSQLVKARNILQKKLINLKKLAG